MKSALEKLSGGNGIAQGMKTSQTVATEQQAKPAAQLNQETFGKMMNGEPITPPKDEHEAAVRMNQATAKGLLNGTIKPVEAAQKPEEKKPEQSPVINQPKSYAEMFAELNKGMLETPEQQRSREKKERTDAIIRSVGDGLSALSRMYFATKGAVTAHNPQNDLTASANKRKEYFQQQREKNKAAWLTGYQRAMALDEEARKNNMTAAEAFRYHNMLADYKNRTADQGDTRLEQNQQKIDLANRKFESQDDIARLNYELKKKVAEGKMSIDEARIELEKARVAVAQYNAHHKGKGSSGNVDYDEKWLEISTNDPNGANKSSEYVAKGGMDPGTKPGRKQAVKQYEKSHPKTAKKTKKAGGKWASGLSLK